MGNNNSEREMNTGDTAKKCIHLCNAMQSQSKVLQANVMLFADLLIVGRTNDDQLGGTC